MERLHFSSDAGYSALEAAIHLGRYAVARSICAGKRVLDVACGEGYGSYQLAAWGAASVEGVDISAEAIAEAKRRFADPRIRYHRSDATSLDRLFPDAKFDLIISLETIEHLTEPEAFLFQVKNLLAPGGTIVISCPNDHWYYDKDQSNPFHIRKYTFNECRSLTEGVLGPASSWRMGTLTAGFVTLRLDNHDLGAAAADDQALMLRNQDVDAAVLVPAPHDMRPTTDNCSFFVGVWGADAGQAAAVTYPLSMDASGRALFGGDRVADLHAYIAELQHRCDGLEDDARHLRVELQEAQAAIDNQCQATEELTSRNSALTDDLRRSEDIRGGLETSLAERLVDISRLEQQISRLEQQISRLEQQQLHMEAELAKERQTHKAEIEVSRRALRQVSLGLHAARSENEVLRVRAREHLVEAERQIERAREHHTYAERQAELAREAQHRLAERDAEIQHLSQSLHDKESRLGAVPWRAVGVYRKMRPLMPDGLLKGMAALIDRSRRAR